MRRLRGACSQEAPEATVDGLGLHQYVRDGHALQGGRNTVKH